MLRRHDYRGCQRLYWTPEDIEGEASDATYEYRGKTHLLEFDGCVDELILNNLKNRGAAAVDIAELYEVIPILESFTRRMDLSSRPPLMVECTRGRKWSVSRRQCRNGSRIVLRSALGQTATATSDSENRIQSLTLRTEGQGITHEIKAKPTENGDFAPVSEAVTVYR